MHVYEIRPHKDRRGVDLISDVLPFGRLWYGEPNAISNALARLSEKDYGDTRRRRPGLPPPTTRRPTPTTTPRTPFGSGSVVGRSNAFPFNRGRVSSTFVAGVEPRQFLQRKKWGQRALFSASTLRKNCLDGLGRRRQIAACGTWSLGLAIYLICVSRGRSSTL